MATITLFCDLLMRYTLFSAAEPAPATRYLTSMIFSIMSDISAKHYFKDQAGEYQ
jgi:hypothetical protein